MSTVGMNWNKITVEPNAVWSLTFVASSLEAGQEIVTSFRSRYQMVSTELFSPLLLRSPQKSSKFEKNLSSQLASGFKPPETGINWNCCSQRPFRNS